MSNTVGNSKKRHKIKKLLEDNKKLIEVISVIIIAVCAIIGLIILYYSSSDTIIVQPNPQNDEKMPYIGANYTIERGNSIETYTLYITNTGDTRADDLNIQIVFPENMTIFDWNIKAEQALKSYSGGNGEYYFNSLYYFIQINRTYEITLWLHNNDGDFLEGETWTIVPVTDIWASTEIHTKPIPKQ